jgi:hypothetical protein
LNFTRRVPSCKLRGYRPGGTKIGWRIRKHDLERFIVPAMNLREGSNKANA